MLTIGSLCSGACDGLSLGAEWAGVGPVKWQVEIDEARRQNLARHWPNADRSVIDVREANSSVLERVDCIVCSAPCKDLSSAGKGAGLGGDQSRLWFECERIIGEILPRWVVVENVASGAIKWVPYIRSGLERFGYLTLPIPIAASDCGAPQERRRVFIVAYFDGVRESAQPIDEEVETASTIVGDAHVQGLRLSAGRSKRTCGAEKEVLGTSTRTHAGWPTQLEVVAPVHGVSGRVVSALGDSVIPQCAEVVFWVIRELGGLS